MTEGRTANGQAGVVRRVALAMVVATATAGCSNGLPKISDLNPFAEKVEPLPGKRMPIMASSEQLPSELAAADRPMALPMAQQNEDWPQPGGAASNANGHPAIGANVRTLWTADAGTGSGSYGRLTAPPIVFGGRIYTIDTTGKVTSFSSGGTAGWRVQLKIEGDRDREASGGGLAIDGGRLYAVAGFGIVAALDPASGKRLWEKSLGAHIRSAPVAGMDKVYFTAGDGRTIALNAGDGSEAWVYRGINETASITAPINAAFESGTLIVPHTSGELVAINASNGQPMWSESLARMRVASSLTAMSDAARPVVDGGTVFAVGHAGRMVATALKTGERLWSVNVPGVNSPWPVGENVFMVDTGGQIMALNRRDGKVLWTAKLPGSDPWSGPVLAGGRLWAVSSKGKLVSADALTGKILATQDLGAKVYITPVVAGGRLYILADNGRLIALG